MLMEQTLDKMNVMKLSGMADALKKQLGSGERARLSFGEQLGLLVDSEWTAREQRLARGRGLQTPPALDRQQVLSLSNCAFIQSRHNLLITGPTGGCQEFCV